MAAKETKERILDASEKLLAEHGFGGVPMRAIASAAEVNLASINYHFGSKEALILAIFQRRVGPLNDERIRRLDELERASGGDPPSVEGIVEAFIRPLLRLRRVHGSEWSVLRRLLGHTMSLPSGRIRDAFLEQFGEVVQRFTAAMRRALPDLSEREILWRLLFMVGTIVHTLAMVDDMPRVSAGRCGSDDAETTVRRLVPFVAAGLRAPESIAEEEAKNA